MTKRITRGKIQTTSYDSSPDEDYVPEASVLVETTYDFDDTTDEQDRKRRFIAEGSEGTERNIVFETTYDFDEQEEKDDVRRMSTDSLPDFQSLLDGTGSIGDGDRGDNDVVSLGDPGEEVLSSDIRSKWSEDLPQLVLSYLVFLGTYKEANLTDMSPRNVVTCKCTTVKTDKSIFLYFSCGAGSFTISFCECKSHAETLVEMGFMPATLNKPATAVHFGLLEELSAMRQVAAISGQAMAKIYNLKTRQTERPLSANICQNLLLLYFRMLLLTEKSIENDFPEYSEEEGCWACPDLSDEGKKGFRFVAMDGNFSLKCESTNTFDKMSSDEIDETLSKIWVDNKVVSKYEALIEENKKKVNKN